MRRLQRITAGQCRLGAVRACKLRFPSVSSPERRKKRTRIKSGMMVWGAEQAGRGVGRREIRIEQERVEAVMETEAPRDADLAE